MNLGCLPELPEFAFDAAVQQSPVRPRDALPGAAQRAEAAAPVEIAVRVVLQAAKLHVFEDEEPRLLQLALLEEMYPTLRRGLNLCAGMLAEFLPPEEQEQGIAKKVAASQHMMKFAWWVGDAGLL